VVGGSDAGIAAALRAREIDPTADIDVVVADAFPNFSICGLPYLLSGEVSDWRDLAHRSRADSRRGRAAPDPGDVGASDRPCGTHARDC
jgi:NADPH-dependent 2,4-dienoyl-CoA reductase/sulfur reductase-like enzyme